jgi:Uma2 family endonuclease
MSETGGFLTRAAEGLDRRGFTLSEVEKMIAAGIIDADEKFELIDGEIVPMSPQASPHMQMKGRIARWLGGVAPHALEIVQDGTLFITENTFFEPDVIVYAANPQRRYVRPDQVSLLIEIADTSRARDLFTKAPRYGAAGVPELWVVELNERVSYVFRGPGTQAWAAPAQIGFDSPLEAVFLPGQSVTLAAFED